MTLTKTSDLRDLCLIWGCPCVAILTISTLVSMKVGADFQQDALAKWMAFLLCNLMLWLLYAMFQSLLADLFASKQTRQAEHDTIDAVANADEPKAIPIVEQSSLYDKRCKEYQMVQEQKRTNIIDAIMDYTTRTMSPFVSNNEELAKLCDEIRKWADDYTYTPVPIRLKQRLTTLDLRHFVWNIGERLGTKNGYNGYARADFIKAMFPEVFLGIELDSIRNFKFQANKGSIVIDEPDKNDYRFHCE